MVLPEVFPPAAPSADGVWRLGAGPQPHYEDERSGPPPSIWLTRTATGERVFLLTHVCWRGKPDFAGDYLTLDLTRGSARCWVRIDLAERTYVFHPRDDAEPLDALDNALYERLRAPAVHVSASRPGFGKKASNVLTLFGSLVFVTIGIWVLLGKAQASPLSAAERWKAVGCIAFFGGIAWIAWREIFDPKA